MAREREVGTLWIGGPLSWMEQLCLKSFVDQGQKITLFSYDDIPNVPAGVIRRDGREIIDTDDFIKYEHKNSFALFADWFRLHMIHQCPGMIWIDTDVYCHRPMDYDSDYVMGFELPGEHRVNNAILGLPHDSDILAQMLEFTEDRHSIAPFLPPKKRREYQAAADAGTPVHISQQPWGVWGPQMVTHYVHALGLQDKVQPLDAFYPITFRERTDFLKRNSLVESRLTDNTTALHIWASNKRELGRRQNGIPRKGTYLAARLKAHGIVPALAPLASRGNAIFDGALLDEVTSTDVQSVADVSGGARGLVLALHHKFDCKVVLVNVDDQGRFESGAQPWLADYIDFLTDNGVPEDRITLVRRPRDMRPVDVLCNLQGFGDTASIKPLERLLRHQMHADTQVFCDIRQGSGGYNFLREFGTVETLSDREENGKKVGRVSFTANPPEPSEEDQSWKKIAQELAGDSGWFRPGPNGHSFLFMPRSTDTLVVTFDNLDIAMNKREDRRPWGHNFIEGQGWSMLGVLAGGWTWYREDWVCQQFDDLAASGFFKGFKRVVFYGASMGGYAAAAFAPAAPGCDVVAISPQSTLDKSVVPWETRYKNAWDRDFSGPYGDAAAVSASARRVTILYDPYEPLDSGHVNRFTNDNVQKLRAPLMGHRLGSSLSQMGILTPIILGALNGTLEDADYYEMLRARKEFPRYQRELFQKAVSKGHTDLAKRLGQWVLDRNANRAIRVGMKALG